MSDAEQQRIELTEQLLNLRDEIVGAEATAAEARSELLAAQAQLRVCESELMEYKILSGEQTRPAIRPAGRALIRALRARLRR